MMAPGVQQWSSGQVSQVLRTFTVWVITYSVTVACNCSFLWLVEGASYERV